MLRRVWAANASLGAPHMSRCDVLGGHGAKAADRRRAPIQATSGRAYTPAGSRPRRASPFDDNAASFAPFDDNAASFAPFDDKSATHGLQLLVSQLVRSLLEL